MTCKIGENEESGFHWYKYSSSWLKFTWKVSVRIEVSLLLYVFNLWNAYFKIVTCTFILKTVCVLRIVDLNQKVTETCFSLLDTAILISLIDSMLLMCILILPPWVNFLPPSMKLLQSTIKQSTTLTWPISTSRCWTWTTRLHGKALGLHLCCCFLRSAGRCGGLWSRGPPVCRPWAQEATGAHTCPESGAGSAVWMSSSSELPWSRRAAVTVNLFLSVW